MFKQCSMVVNMLKYRHYDMTSNSGPTPVTALIIPTLNEADNIVKLITAYCSLPYPFHIIIADSNSPDGTAQKVTGHFGGNSSVTVINCAQRGRGASVVYAYEWILQKKLPVVAVATSDADGSHDPNDFHKMVQAFKNADVVIGSRYVHQSKIVGWPLSRRLFSRAANLLARLTLRVGITDYTNGYRLFTLAALKQLDLKAIDADGYIHLSQELLQWHNRQLKIVEVPTIFVNRQRGKSNFKLKLVLESFWIIIKLGWKNRRC